jgi:hypothetical protein
MGPRATVVICMLAASLCRGTSARAQGDAPAPVQGVLAELKQMCEDAGGKPAASPGLLQVADLTGDGLADYVLDHGSFNCDGAASLFSGSGGSQMSVYVGMPGGQAKQAFTSGTFGVKLEKGSAPARLKILLSGELCGQKVTERMSRAEYKSCWRPVVWSPRSKAFALAPVSQIQPVQ